MSISMASARNASRISVNAPAIWSSSLLSVDALVWMINQQSSMEHALAAIMIIALELLLVEELNANANSPSAS